MKAERIRELAEKALNNGFEPRWWDMDYGEVVQEIKEQIRLALAEERREIAEWARRNRNCKCAPEDECFSGMVYCHDLLAFLEGEKS